MTNDFTIGVPPTARRGRNGQWVRRFNKIKQAINDGSLTIAPDCWVIFATDLTPVNGSKLAYNYRRAHPDFEWTVTTADNISTVWCRPL